MSDCPLCDEREATNYGNLTAWSTGNPTRGVEYRGEDVEGEPFAVRMCDVCLLRLLEDVYAVPEMVS